MLRHRGSVLALGLGFQLEVRIWAGGRLGLSFALSLGSGAGAEAAAEVRSQPAVSGQLGQGAAAAGAGISSLPLSGGKPLPNPPAWLLVAPWDGFGSVRVVNPAACAGPTGPRRHRSRLAQALTLLALTKPSSCE